MGIMNVKFMQYTILIMTYLLLLSCDKQAYIQENTIDHSVELIQSYEPNLHEDVIHRVKGSRLSSNFLLVIPDTVYTSSDLLDFLSVYGTIVPDITPEFVNYYQDIGSGHTNAKLDNLTTPEDENRVYEWFINNSLVYTGYNLPLVATADLLECEGVMMIKLKVTDPVTLAEYEREQWSYIEYLFIPDSLACDCTDCPFYWDVFPLPPTPGPYDYQTKHAKWDLDHNNLITIDDLLIFLSYYN